MTTTSEKIDTEVYSSQRLTEDHSDLCDNGLPIGTSYNLKDIIDSKTKDKLFGKLDKLCLVDTPEILYHKQIWKRLNDLDNQSNDIVRYLNRLTARVDELEKVKYI